MKAETIKLKYSEIRNENFTQTLQRMIDSRFPTHVTQSLLLIAKITNEHRKLSDQLIAKIYDDIGEVVPAKDKIPEHKQIKAEHQEEANKRFTEVMTLDFDTGVKKINPIVLGNFEMTVSELVCIGPVFTNLVPQDLDEKDPLTPGQSPQSSSSPQLSAVQ